MSQPRIINVSKWLREDRYMGRTMNERVLSRHDLRRSVKKDRASGRTVLLYARPGSVVLDKGRKCIVSNKGRLIPFAASK